MALNEAQRSSFSARINHCLEIAKAGEVASKVEESELADAVEDIELDVVSILMSYSGSAGGTSMYIVNSVWSTSAAPGSLSVFTSDEFNKFYSRSLAYDLSDSYEVKCWLGRWSRALVIALEQVEQAKSFSSALSALVQINALVASFLSFSSVFRLLGKSGC